MSSNTRSWLVWLIPFFVSIGMALGALIGISCVSEALRQEGPAGDIAGAAGAMMVVICLVVGFVMAAFTVVVAKMARRGAPDRIALRFGLNILGGGIIGALGANVQDVSTTVTWLLLIVGPVLLTWFCGTGNQFPAGNGVKVKGKTHEF